MKLVYKNYLYEAVAIEKTPAFKAWFGDSKVVDYDDNPLPVYHGTTHDFDSFNIKKTYKDSYVGKGFYFTDNTDDASVNYAGQGPDATFKINSLIDEIRNSEPEDIAELLNVSVEELEKADKSNTLKELIRDHAKGRIIGDDPKPNVMPVYLKMLNPFYIGEEYKQYFEYNYSFDEETEEEIGPEGNGVELLEALEEAVSETDIPDVRSFMGKILEELNAFEGGFWSNDFARALMNYEGLIDYTNNEGESLTSGKLFKESILKAGFDVVIMSASVFETMKHTALATHYIVYSPNQIKSVFNRNPTEDDNITKE